jgi:hypothetical protein
MAIIGFLFLLPTLLVFGGCVGMPTQGGAWAAQNYGHAMLLADPTREDRWIVQVRKPAAWSQADAETLAGLMMPTSCARAALLRTTYHEAPGLVPVWVMRFQCDP